MTEISDRYRRLAGAFADRVAAVPPDRWASPSPCGEWTTRELVRHVVDSESLFEHLVARDIADVPSVDDDPLGAFNAVRKVIQADLDDPERASAGFDGFQGPTTFEKAVDRFVCFDLVVHAWDLARAAGLDERLDPTDVQRVVDQIPEFGDMLRSPGVCGPEIDVADDADDQTRMLALLGRRA